MTSLAEERRSQEHWSSRLRRSTPVYDRFLEQEFENPEHCIARNTEVLTTLLHFAATNVPYKVVRSTGPVLSLKYVDAIERAPGGKY